MTKDQEKVIALVQLQIEPDETVDEGKIKELVEFFRNLIYLSEEGTSVRAPPDHSPCRSVLSQVPWMPSGHRRRTSRRNLPVCRREYSPYTDS